MLGSGIGIGREQRAACTGGAAARRARSRRRDLDDPAEVHHRDPVGDVPHDRQVVRDEEVGQAELAAAAASSRLTIWAWIETSSAETGSSQTMKRRLDRQRPGDADALPLAARELVRIAVGCCRRSGRPARAARRPALAARVARHDAVDRERLGDDRRRRSCAGRATRTGPGRPSASRAASARSVASPSSSVRSAPSKRDPARGRLVEPQERAAERRLAAAGLADQPERLARARSSRLDPVDRVDVRRPPAAATPRRTGKCLTRSVDLEQAVVGADRYRRSAFAARRRPRSAGMRPCPIAAAASGGLSVEQRVERERAARLERAAGRQGGQVRRRARDRAEPARRAASSRGQRLQQRPGVRVARAREQLVARRRLDHPAGVHHDHPVGTCRRRRRGRG